VRTRSTTLGELCAEGGGEIQTGPFGSQLHARDYVLEGVPSVMPQNIGDNVIVADGIARVSREDASRLSRYLLREGDIVYSRRGDVEKRALVRAENAGWLCGTGCLRVRLGTATPNDPRFLAYALGAEDVRDWIVRHAVGATMPNLNTSILGAVPLQVPKPSEQRAIADVLGALDDKIAANAQERSLLHRLALAEFDRLMRHVKTYVPLGSVVNLEYGKSLPATQRRVGAVDVFGSGGVVGSHDTSLVDGPGVVLGRKGTAGAVHWAPRAFFPIDTTFYVVPRDPSVSLIYAYFALKWLRLDDRNSDSAVPGLNREEALAATIPLPAAADLVRFTAVASASLDLASRVELESKALAATRDALLPALMSGRLRVRDAASGIPQSSR